MKTKLYSYYTCVCVCVCKERDGIEKTQSTYLFYQTFSQQLIAEIAIHSFIHCKIPNLDPLFYFKGMLSSYFVTNIIGFIDECTYQVVMCLTDYFVLRENELFTI